MNHDAKFQQIWEFRRREYDGDSSDDSESNPSLEPSHNKKPQSAVVGLLDNDEETETSARHKHDTANGVETAEPAKRETVQPAKRKRKSNKKENVVKDKSKSRCSAKEEKKAKEPIKLDDTKEVGMFDDLKNFADSLIRELAVARENMFAQMKRETRKLLASRQRKKRDVRSNLKNKTPPQNGIQSDWKSAKCPGGMIEEYNKSEKISKLDQVLEIKMTNKQPFESERENLIARSQVHLAKDHNQPVSSPYLTMPTVVPKPHYQSHRDINHLNGCAPDRSDARHLKPISPGYYYQEIPVMQAQQFRGFSHINSRNLGFPDQNCSGMTSECVGFQVPITQELGSGLDDCSNLSSQTYSDNMFQDNSGSRMRMNARFSNGGSGTSSRRILRTCVSNDVQKNGGDFAQFRSQEMKGQFYPGFRNNQ